MPPFPHLAAAVNDKKKYGICTLPFHCQSINTGRCLAAISTKVTTAVHPCCSSIQALSYFGIMPGNSRYWCGLKELVWYYIWITFVHNQVSIWPFRGNWTNLMKELWCKLYSCLINVHWTCTVTCCLLYVRNNHRGDVRVSWTSWFKSSLCQEQNLRVLWFGGSLNKK